MKNSILTFFHSLILGTTLAYGANVVINPGQSSQPAIDASSAGDKVAAENYMQHAEHFLRMNNSNKKTD